MQSLYNFVNMIYEKFAYHVKYEIDSDENIKIIEKNIHFKSTNFILAAVIVVILICVLSIIGVLSEALIEARDERIFINRYKAKEICIENSYWTECFSTPELTRMKIYFDDSDIPVLYIKED